MRSITTDGAYKTKALLKKMAIFSTLEEEELRTVAFSSEYCSFRKGEIIFRSGDPGEELYIVEQGDILIYRETDKGEETVIARYLPGECFGELDLMSNSLRNAVARAETDSVLLRFPKKGTHLSEVLKNYPAISAQLLHKFLVLIAGRIRNANALIKENSPWIQELRKQVYSDKLTGLYNRTFLEEKLSDYLKDGESAVSILMFKPDNFKAINDTYGHQAGDTVLQIMSRALKDMLGEHDFGVRYMGNELSVLLSRSGAEEALQFAEKIREVMRNLDIREVTGGDDFRITVSIGISVFPDHGTDAATLIDKAHSLPLIGRAQGGDTILFPKEM